MAGLIFGIILLIVGIGLSIFCGAHAVEEDVNTSFYRMRGETPPAPKMTHPFKKYMWIPLVAGILLCALLIMFGCMVTVDTGHTGVVTTFGRVEDKTFDSGFHLKMPWQSVKEMDNRVQKATIDLSCFSKDIQEVTVVYTLNYQISKANAQDIYRSIGKDYYGTVVTPNISESVKTITAQYKADELIEGRATLANRIEELLKDSLKRYNIEVVSTAIEDMDFTDEFTNAVEAKQVAEQNKLRAITEQEQKTIEAQQAAARAKIQADADAEVAEINANANATVAVIQANADKEVAEIGADSAEYQGKKDAAIKLQALASINGWTVVQDEATGVNQLVKPDGTVVSEAERAAGVENLIKYYYTQTWDGTLPQTYVGDDSVDAILIGN